MGETETSSTPLRTGIPLLSELDQHLASEEYQRHVEFNQAFLARNDAAMSRYGRLWAKDTFRLWSRRWEYPFAAGRIIAHAQAQGDASQPYKVLDAGSGVTYFPYFLCERIGPRCDVTCFDFNASYHGMFEQIHANAANGAGIAARVRFVEGMLQKMPFDSGSFDAVCCISVLEHTSNYSEILDEFNRVLKPGGLLVITFDLSLDGRFELPRATAEKLLREVSSKFHAPPGVDLLGELDRMDESQRDRIVSTDYFRQAQPDLLPWKHPLAKAAYDLVTGQGWTGGFRSKSVYCLDARARG